MEKTRSVLVEAPVYEDRFDDAIREFNSALLRCEAAIPDEIFRHLLFHPSTFLDSVAKQIRGIMEVTNPGARGVAHREVPSMVLCRLCFELLANVAFVMFAPKHSFPLRFEMWCNSRNQIRPASVAGGSSLDWIVYIDLLPDRARERVLRSEKVQIGHGADGKEIRYISTREYELRFEDVFDENFFEKSKSIPLGDRALFIDKYKIFSHAAKGNFYSVWPTWILQNPAEDAEQCIRIFARMADGFRKIVERDPDYLER